MEPSKEAIAARITRLNRQILGKVTTGSSKLKKTIDREALLDALTVLYDECNEDPVKKCDELVRAFVDKYRSTVAELRRTRVCLSDFEILQTIGRGHFGEVYMVREKQTSDVYALKTLRKEQARRRAAGAAEDERDVLATAAGPWFPKLQYAFQDTSSLHLVMELCSGGDLAGLLARRNHPLSEHHAAFYVAEAAHALKTLHSMGYVHRDVKPHNIFLDRCGHVKLGDLGSCARLSEGGEGSLPVGTPDYVAPELLAAADCAARHHVCLEYCRGIQTSSISACDYWSLGVVAFELVTLKRPFSSGDEDTIPQILGNIQKYERDPNSEPPFAAAPSGPSPEWRALVAGLLRVLPARRYSYLDTIQHVALSHLPTHTIRDQAPPWVPCVRGPEDACYFTPPPRATPAPSAAPFRPRPPFAGQLPYIGYSYVATEESDDSTASFTSHDCTAIDLATFKSSEKLASLRGREIASLQSKLAAAEACAGAEVERARRAAEAEAERTRARLQAEITALSLQNRRLERQVEVEKEEHMSLDRRNQELASVVSERASVEVRAAQAACADAQTERDALRERVRTLEATVTELQAECARAQTAVDSANAQQKHYKDTIAKERALRRQTLSGGEAESRESAARVAQAEAQAAREARARAQAETKLVAIEDENARLQAEICDLKRDLTRTKESLLEKRRVADTSTEHMKELQMQLVQERVRCSALAAQVQELERCVESAAQREVALEEQASRTEARLQERLNLAESSAAHAAQDDARHREKVNTLEKLVRQLEREVTALESRACPGCDARANDEGPSGARKDAHSDTESVGDAQTAFQAQASVLKEQLERAETQLQARAEEIAALKQEARSANLARWRKEREFNELSVEAKSTARDLKRVEERLAIVLEARKTAEQKATEAQKEIVVLKPQHERASKELERIKLEFDKLKKEHEVAQAEVDRSRNDIRKLKSELQYSEKRRMHAEEQEEMSSRERAQLRDEVVEIRAQNNDLVQNNKALQEACGLLEEQLTDLETLADLHEIKHKDLESETKRLRCELEQTRSRLMEAERAAAERAVAADLATRSHDDARDLARHTHCQLQLLQERLENREQHVAELENKLSSLESSNSATEAALTSAMRRIRELQEECSTLRTRAHEHHAEAMQLRASLAETQEELADVRETSEAATAWWRTRETKADATLRQQAKLIDFLQAKVEEAGRKKCSLSRKLFGRSGRRTATSPPLRRANRELREEVERLRTQLASTNMNGDNGYPATPKSKRNNTKKASGGLEAQNDTTYDKVNGDATDNTLQAVWSDGSRERVRVRCEGDALVLTSGGTDIKATLLHVDPKNLPQNEANRAFNVKLYNSSKGSEATLVCGNMSERAHWVSRACPATPLGYTPDTLLTHDTQPAAALYVAPDALAVGCTDGLHSLRGVITLQPECAESCLSSESVESLSAGSGRALVVSGGALWDAGLLSLGSALRRATSLKPVVTVNKVPLPDLPAPNLVQAMSGNTCVVGVPCAVSASGRRVFLLRFDAATAEWSVARAITVDRRPAALLLTSHALYIAGEIVLKLVLPSGALEAFAMDEPTVLAAAKKHSLPKALLLIHDDPVEILICYAECGVFVDASGKRTRSEDPKWSSAAHEWQFVSPFLYLAGDDKVTILYINDEAYRMPPCTCDTTSLESNASECYMPEKFHLKLKQPHLLGVAPNGVIVSHKVDSRFSIAIVEGMAAFRSVGASIESLATIESKESSTDQAPSLGDLTETGAEIPHEQSHESVEVNTGFLADIRKKAQQLRRKNRKAQTPEDVIKEILASEVGVPHRPRASGRKSPMASEFDSDESDRERDSTESTNETADICADMFARQVRFQ